MNPTAPHYLLFTQSNDSKLPGQLGGSWRFVLEEIGSDFRIEEGDVEPNMKGERLQLLAVIRGLEAIDQPAHVTLVTPSKYVGRGIRGGLSQWKANDWHWEDMGVRQPIKHVKFWKRIDAALKIHRISCRVWQFDVPHVRVQQNETERVERTRKPLIPTFEGSSDFASTTSHTNSDDRPNRIRINDEMRKRFFKSSHDSTETQSNFLIDRIKPIGQGRAYGYAIN